MTHYTPTAENSASEITELVQWVIDRLKALDYEVGTKTIYLLNSTYHPITTICKVGKMEMSLDFTTSSGVTFDGRSVPRIRADVIVGSGKPKRYLRHVLRGWDKGKILRYMILKLREFENGQRIQSVKDRKKVLAAENLAVLADQLNLDVVKSTTIEGNNFKVKLLGGYPTMVLLLVRVNHSEAIEIIDKYMTKGKKSQKP